MNVAPYVILYLIPAAISAALAMYAWQRRQSQAARPFSLLMAAVVFWSVCHALSAASSTLEAILFWAQVQYAGIVLVGPLWLLFALAYADGWSRTTRGQRIGLLVPALLALAAVLTNSRHHLWWPTVGVDAGRPFGSLSVTRGVLFWVHFAYTYGCVVLGFALFVRALIAAPALYRRQAALVVGGALFPLVGNLAHLLGLRTSAVDDPTPFLFAASGLAMFYAALRYQFLDLMPIAQREIFASLPDGVVVLDRRGVVASINDLAPALLAATADDWVGRPLLEIVAGSPLEIDLRALLAAPTQPAARTIVYEGASGLRAVEIRLRPLRAERIAARTHARPNQASEEGASAGALLVLREQTGRAQAERALEQRLDELTTINQLARTANAALQTGDIVRAITRELARALPGDRIVIGMLPGYQDTTEEHHSATLHLAIDETLHSAPTLEGQMLTGADFARLQSVLRTGRPQVVSVDEPALAGTQAQAMLQREGLRTVVVAPLHSQAVTLGAMFIGRADARAITPDELRLFETVGELVADAITRTRLYEQAEAASRAKSAFLATVSHELRTPLTSIIGFTDMLDQGIFGALPERASEPLSHIRRSGYTLLRMINDILDFSKIEAGHFIIDRYPVDIPMVIHAVVDTLQPQIQARGLELKVEVAPALPLAYANSERLEQVLMNLIANAVKFTDHGSITVRAGADGARVRFSVADTGVGIAPEQRGALFHAFRQISSGPARRPGTGLGLAISRRLVELMGGEMTVESALGVGSTFSCDLPIASEKLRERAAADHSPEPRTSG